MKRLAYILTSFVLLIGNSVVNAKQRIMNNNSEAIEKQRSQMFSFDICSNDSTSQDTTKHVSHFSGFEPKGGSHGSHTSHASHSSHASHASHFSAIG